MKIKLFIHYERWTDVELEKDITDTRIIIPLGSCAVEVPDFAIPSENKIKGRSLHHEIHNT